MPLVADIAHVAASQIVVEATPQRVASPRRAATIVLARRAAALIAGGDQRIVGGWHDFDAVAWLNFGSTEWRDFASRRSIGKRAGRRIASQIIVEIDLDDADTSGRSAARQVVASTAGNISPAHHVAASQIVSASAAEIVAHANASQLVTI